MNTILLQVFLLIDVFLIGSLAAIAVRHAYAHFRPHTDEKPRILAAPAPIHLPPAVRQRIIEETEENFMSQLNQSIAELQRDLKVTSTNLNNQLQQLGSEVAVSERGRYFKTLEELRLRTENAIKAAQNELTDHQATLKTKMAETVAAEQQQQVQELVAEKERLVKQIDTKLADAVASFLTETLQHNVDLGAQTAYLTATLEEHKDEFKREVQGEVPTAK
jgi:hypothetical protein